MADPYPLATLQPNLDARFGHAMVTSLLTGTYITIFSRTIGPVFRDGRRLLGGSLVLLFCLNIINLGTIWGHARDVYVLHNTTPLTEYAAYFRDSLAYKIDDVVIVACILIADFSMACRCCMLWPGNRYIAGFYAILLLTQIAFIPPFILQAYFQFPFHVAARFSFLSVYLFLSGGITISATTLIIIRIKNVSGVGKYSYVIEALIQSGVMYSLSTLASSTILVIATSRLDNVALVQISTYASVFAVPIAGISMTQIASRIASENKRMQEDVTKPLSTLVFEAPQPHAPVASSHTYLPSRADDGSLSHLSFSDPSSEVTTKNEVV